MSSSALTFLLIAAALAYLWYSSLQARELATRIAMDTCERQQVQFLDQTVALRRLQLARDASGRLRLRRTYLFEYTEDAAIRQTGFVIVTAGRVESVGLQS